MDPDTPRSRSISPTPAQTVDCGSQTESRGSDDVAGLVTCVGTPPCGTSRLKLLVVVLGVVALVVVAVVFAVGFFYLGKDQCESPVVEEDTSAGGSLCTPICEDCSSANTAGIAAWFLANC